MFSKNNDDLPLMKYSKGQKVNFEFQNDNLQGVIEILDFCGSLENDYHSYDIYVEDSNTLYKHIPENNISGL